ncbi:DUF4956 domain-containing protein [Candidatus Pelagibacter sp.]|nr:DUF4956 domain-containing protein [Candidatus Pelagibacter sp.]
MNLNSGSSLTVFDIFIALFASLICAAIISYTYKNTYQGVLYQKSFNLSLILISLITTSVIIVISGNLVLSLGMVGALSIIRFRSAVKDPIDIVFMFWAVSIGIANGVAAFKVSFLTSIIISVVIILIKKIPLSSKPFILIIKTNVGNEKILDKIISTESNQYFLKSKNINGNHEELIFEIRIKDDLKITKKISQIKGVKDVNLISSSNNVLDN